MDRGAFGNACTQPGSRWPQPRTRARTMTWLRPQTIFNSLKTTLQSLKPVGGHGNANNPDAGDR